MDGISQIADRLKNGNEYAELCFSRKYRASNKTKYKFYRANLHKDVSHTLKNWLLRNIDSLNNKELTQFPEDDVNSRYSIDLNGINNWGIFRDNAFSLSCQKVTDLKTIKNSLNSHIIYISLDDFLVGQITRMRPSNVLIKKGCYKLGFDNSTFNAIKEEQDVELKDNYDLLFICKGKEDLGIIYNEDNFEHIFDMNEQYQKEAEKIVRTSKIFQCFEDQNKVINMVASDRIIQKMLRNPISQRCFAEIQVSDITKIKQCLNKIVRFEIENDKIIIPSGNEKEAFKELIKAVGNHFNKTLVDDRLIESSPKRFLS